MNNFYFIIVLYSNITGEETIPPLATTKKYSHLHEGELLQKNFKEDIREKTRKRRIRSQKKTLRTQKKTLRHQISLKNHEQTRRNQKIQKQTKKQ